MAIVINEECIACGTCLDACEFEAIDEGDPIYIINGNCTECKACIEVCPVEAIIEK